jgi:hypothetical protein
MTHSEAKAWLTSIGGWTTGPDRKAEDFDEVVVGARGAERRAYVGRHLQGDARKEAEKIAFTAACAELETFLAREI